MATPQVDCNKQGAGINQKFRKRAFEIAYGIQKRPKWSALFAAPTYRIGNGLLNNKDEDNNTISYESVLDLADALMEDVITQGCYGTNKGIAEQAQNQLHFRTIDPKQALDAFAQTLSQQLESKKPDRNGKKFNKNDRLYTHLDFLLDICKQELTLTDDDTLVAELNKTLNYAQPTSRMQAHSHYEPLDDDDDNNKESKTRLGMPPIG